MLDLLYAAAGTAGTALLAVAAGAARALTPLAAGVAGAFGIAVVVLAGFGFLTLLVWFVVISALATRYRFREKLLRHVQEGKSGERGVSNVVAHVVLPTTIAVATAFGLLSGAAPAVLFGAALAFGLADTLASEFGVLSGSARSLLTLRPVVPGTNGGVSAAGQAFAVIGAAGTALAGSLAFYLAKTPFGPVAEFVLVVTAAGFVACQVDSVLGETLENRGYLTKGGTNFLGMLAAIGIAAAFLVALG